MSYGFISVAQGRADSLHSPCKVEPHDPNRTTFAGRDWDALWDTGATCTVITSNIAKDLNLAPVSYAPVSGVYGQGQAAVYFVDIGLPNGVIVQEIPVVEGNPLGCDMLIGMDIIGYGDFMVSCCGGTTHFGLRMPSFMAVAEMTQLLQMSSNQPTVKTGKQVGRNSQCPCGSGKKYKQCCGKV